MILKSNTLYYLYYLVLPCIIHQIIRKDIIIFYLVQMCIRLLDNCLEHLERENSKEFSKIAKIIKHLEEQVAEKENIEVEPYAVI